jgi:hypothetical protein
MFPDQLYDFFPISYEESQHHHFEWQHEALASSSGK